MNDTIEKEPILKKVLLGVGTYYLFFGALLLLGVFFGTNISKNFIIGGLILPGTIVAWLVRLLNRLPHFVIVFIPSLAVAFVVNLWLPDNKKILKYIIAGAVYFLVGFVFKEQITEVVHPGVFNYITLAFILFFLWISSYLGDDYFGKELSIYDFELPAEVDFDKYLDTSKKIAKEKGYRFTFLGYNGYTDQSALIFDEERKRHTQIIGSTGTGKTHFVMLPMIKQDIEKGRGIIFIDAKGDIETAKTVYKLCADSGRGSDFEMFSMNNPELSKTYNPLELGNATQLKDKIIETIPMTEPHYERECENALQILFNDYFKKHETIDLRTLYKLLMNPGTETPNYLDYYEEHKKNLGGLYNEIGLIINTEFGDKLNGNEMNLYRGYMDNKIMYFALNILAYGKSGRRLGKLITGDINTLCGVIQSEEKAQRKETGIYIDEYKEFGTPAFTNTLAQGRSANFMITIAHQSIGDLKAIDKNHPEQVQTNTNTRIVLKTNDNETPREISKEIGTYRTIKRSRGVEVDGEVKMTGTGGETVGDEFFVPEQLIKKLKVGEACLKTPSDYGIVKLRPVFMNTSEIELPAEPGTGTDPGAEPEVSEPKNAQDYEF